MTWSFCDKKSWQMSFWKMQKIHGKLAHLTFLYLSQILPQKTHDQSKTVAMTCDKIFDTDIVDDFLWQELCQCFLWQRPWQIWFSVDKHKFVVKKGYFSLSIQLITKILKLVLVTYNWCLFDYIWLGLPFIHKFVAINTVTSIHVKALIKIFNLKITIYGKFSSFFKIIENHK